eukprot:TRINITY_DN94597_c0_g1_i1.p1 TRINITY_DN94597_c0_g1~~TRINITY_DN94597_c0_g1_i1.p1  ORF type:complete len:265 (-),score=70.20 TRINITY_DN94597_c0_g1_i1:59-853(-)
MFRRTGNTLVLCAALVNAAARQAEDAFADLDHYTLLGHNEPGTGEELSTQALKSAYRRKALEHHPDKCARQDAERKELCQQEFIRLTEAYETLRDPLRRSRYDREFRRKRRRRRTTAEQENDAGDSSRNAGGGGSKPSPRHRQRKQSRSSFRFEEAAKTWNSFAQENAHHWRDLEQTQIRIEEQFKQMKSKLHKTMETMRDTIDRTRKMQKRLNNNLDKIKEEMKASRKSMDEMLEGLQANFERINKKVDRSSDRASKRKTAEL